MMASAAQAFGRYRGRTARLFTLRGDRLTAQITDFGGALVSLEAPDRTGRPGGVLLGFDDVALYAGTPGSFGALLGRNANRIAGGRIVVDGETIVLAKNEPDATLHGGPLGFGKRFWEVVAAEPSRLSLALASEDGDQGFPGEVTAQATYELAGSALRLTFDAQTTRPTPITLSAHPYFNLDGLGALHCLDHAVQIFAPHYLPTDSRQIPTGEIAAVAATPFDFSQPCPIVQRIRADHPQLCIAHGFDHYFVLPPSASNEPRLAARVEAANSGRVLEILTTQPGLQFYTGNNLDGSARGRGGLYRQSAGFAFEPQGFPDAPNHPNFPSTLVRPGERYHQEIVYRFSIAGETT